MVRVQMKELKQTDQFNGLCKFVVDLQLTREKFS
jgi:hypothetical protein